MPTQKLDFNTTELDGMVLNPMDRFLFLFGKIKNLCIAVDSINERLDKLDNAKKECDHDFITTDEVDVYQCKKCGGIAKEPTLESIQQSKCNHEWKLWQLSNYKREYKCVKCGAIE